MSIDYNSLLKQYRDNGVIIDVKNGDSVSVLFGMNGRICGGRHSLPGIS